MTDFIRKAVYGDPTRMTSTAITVHSDIGYVQQNTDINKTRSIGTTLDRPDSLHGLSAILRD